MNPYDYDKIMFILDLIKKLSSESDNCATVEKVSRVFSLHALSFFAAPNYIAVLMAPYPCDGLRASYLVGRMSNN